MNIISSKTHRFVIFNTPNDINLTNYIQKFNKHEGKIWVRACYPLYKDDLLLKNNLKVYDLSFPDGQTPSKDIINKWLKILEKYPNETIGVHCVAGLGRAPFLVAIGLINDGCDCLEAIKNIREIIPGALNIVQIRFLNKFKKPGKPWWRKLIKQK